MKTKSVLLLAVLALTSGCGRHSGSPANPAVSAKDTHETFLSIEDKFPALMGDWKLASAPVSWQDFGSDVLRFTITNQEFSYEKMGHVAQQSFFFNLSGHNYGGDCHFRVTGKEYGIKIMEDGVSLRFAVYPDLVELLPDPANHFDCAEQITRLNHVLDRHGGYDLLGFVNSTTVTDINHLTYTPVFFTTGKPRTYVRTN